MNKYQKFALDFLVIAGSMGGSALIAANIGYTQLGYSLFLLSSIATVALMLKSNISRSLVFINFYFIAVNAVGIVRYA